MHPAFDRFFNATYHTLQQIEYLRFPFNRESFYSCHKLESIAIPNSVTSIDDFVFSFCESLTELTLPCSIKTIGDYAFSGIPFLKQFIISKGSLNHFKELLPEELWNKLIEN